MSSGYLNTLLTKLLKGYQPGKEELGFLLSLKAANDIRQLFNAARIARKRHFGNKVFMYGFLYFSTYCRNNCRFCQYRKSNKGLLRYRKTMTQILTAAEKIADAGVHLIDLTMGEDPWIYDSGFKSLVRLIKDIRRTTGLPVMISPGLVTEQVVDNLAAAETDWFACYQETYNQRLFATLRQGQDFDERIARKKQAKNRGMLIEEGILTGVGETLDDLTESIINMQNLPADQIRAMTFVPRPDTPMAREVSQDSLQECRIIAVMRLMMPDRLIPASLDVDGLQGLCVRLDAGANVVTSIVPPENGLAGVANRSLDIEESRRSVDHVQKILASCSLKAADPEDYQAWIYDRLNLSDIPYKKGQAC